MRRIKCGTHTICSIWSRTVFNVFQVSDTMESRGCWDSKIKTCVIAAYATGQLPMVHVELLNDMSGTILFLFLFLNLNLGTILVTESFQSRRQRVARRFHDPGRYLPVLIALRFAGLLKLELYYTTWFGQSRP